MYINDKLIKLLGGYTKKEMQREKNRYQAMLDSQTDARVAKMVNEYIFRLLKDLYLYAKSLYMDSFWQSKIFNVIFNNMLRVMTKYNNSSIIYRLDTTLENKDQFKNVLMEDGKNDFEIEEILHHILETD